MKPETLELQQQLDPTTGAQAVEEIKFPIAVTAHNGRFKYLIMGEHKEIVIYDWYLSETNGAGKLRTGEGTEIPASDLIAELKSIIAELEK